MTKPKHTTLPWKWLSEPGFKDSGGLADVVDLMSPSADDNILSCPIDTDDGFVYGPSPEDKAFIVRACNNYYPLLHALEAYVDADSSDQPPGVRENAITAIAKAEGEPNE